MKRKTIIMTLLAVLGVSCTEKYTPVPDPEVPESGQYLFRAEVEDFDGSYVWTEKDSPVGVYTGTEADVPFVLRKAYEGCTGEVQIYGSAVTGQAYACLPRTEYAVAQLSDGRIPLPAVQSYRPGWKSQIKDNCILAASSSDGKFTFAYPCGALKITLKINFSSPLRRVILTADQNICGNLDISGEAAEKITDASKSITVESINLECSESAPLDVWFMLPEGSYSGLFVNAESDGEAVAALLDGTYTIERCKETTAQASEEHHDYGTPDFDEEQVQID